MADSKFETKTISSHDEDDVKTIMVDPTPKGSKDLMSTPKDGSPSDSISCISSGSASSSVKEIEVGLDALTTDHGMSDYGYYYPGFNGSFGEWEDQYYVLGSDGSDFQHPPKTDEVGEDKKQVDMKSSVASPESFVSTVTQAEKLLGAISLKG